MPDQTSDDSLNLPGSLSAAQLLAALRYEEDLHYKLTRCLINPAADENSFGFASTVYDPPAIPDPDAFLKLYAFAQLPAPGDDAAVTQNLQDFGDFGGGSVVWSGTIRVTSAETFVIFYRGADPEFPQAHAPSPADPALPFFPEGARQAFDPQQILADLPLQEAKTMRMPLQGLQDSVISYFQNDQGKVDAFVMMTVANIDTDGPHGSSSVDPWYQAETSLKDGQGASCDSRQFPGFVRSVHLREHFGLKLGDFLYLYYNGKAVPCQIYDQGPDDKIGEISIYAARAVGIIPPSMSDKDAATKGDSVSNMITLCFPGSCPTYRAQDLDTIGQQAQQCLQAFITRLKGQPSAASTTPPPSLATGTAGPGGVPAPAVYPRSAWGANPPKVASFPPAAAQGIVIHNTQDPNRPVLGDPTQEQAAAFALSRRIQHSHMVDRGWSDVGQHFTISRGGVIMEARAGTLAAAAKGQVVRGAHAGVSLYNQHWWGIENEGDYRQDPSQFTTQQRDALVTLCRWLGSFIPAFDPNEHIKAHREVKPGGTDCPGLLLDPSRTDDILTQVRNAI